MYALCVVLICKCNSPIESAHRLNRLIIMCGREEYFNKNTTLTLPHCGVLWTYISEFKFLHLILQSAYIIIYKYDSVVLSAPTAAQTSPSDITLHRYIRKREELCKSDSVEPAKSCNQWVIYVRRPHTHTIDLLNAISTSGAPFNRRFLVPTAYAFSYIHYNIQMCTRTVTNVRACMEWEPYRLRRMRMK